jgi:anhydro-N-acetylmuramic acid kinase
MGAQKVYRAIGLMSGTSLDGEIDVALIETDGLSYVKALGSKPFPYDLSVREKVRACFGKRERDAAVEEAEALVTDMHVQAVKTSGFQAEIIGFHGQTITHAPEDRFTWQLGDGARLARETGIDVVCDMRQADVKAGGQGAPLIPLYHAAMMAGQAKPVAVLNLGGVGNVTFIDAKGEITAFDTGPANALMDDLCWARMGAAFDEGGVLARAGTVDPAVVADFLAHPYFQKTGAKSLDRNQWSVESAAHLSDEDALATLAEMSVQSVKAGLAHCAQAPAALYVCGGGRKNAYLMERLAQVLDVPVLKIEDAGWNGDATEAEGFAYLAVRSLLGLPLSLPSTTGVPQPITGGILHKAG